MSMSTQKGANNEMSQKMVSTRSKKLINSGSESAVSSPKQLVTPNIKRIAPSACTALYIQDLELGKHTDAIMAQERSSPA